MRDPAASDNSSAADVELNPCRNVMVFKLNLLSDTAKNEEKSWFGGIVS